MGVADKHLVWVAAGAGRSDGNSRCLVEPLAVSFGAGEGQMGNQMLKSRPPLHRLYQLSGLVRPPFPTQVFIFDTQVEAQGLQLFEVEVIDEELVELNGVGLGHGVW